MKKITTFVFILICSLSSFAQFDFKNSDGSLITDGTILVYNNVGDYLNFRVTNTSTIPLDIKIKCTGLVNSNGTQFELCYGGSCFDSVSLNGIYPDYENLLQPGQSNPSQGEHFVNFNGNTTTNIDYQFSVYALGFESQAINFTYRYSPQLNVNSFESLEAIGIKVENTVVRNTLEFATTENGSVALYNINGQKVAESTYVAGLEKVDVSNLSNSIYIARFTNTNGATSPIKLIKK